MEFVRTLARACRVVPLGLIVSAGTAEAAPYAGTAEAAPYAGTAAAQLALSANGQQLNNLIGRGVALADFNGDGALDAFVVNQVTWQSHDGRVYLGDGRGQLADSAQRLTAPGPADQPLVFDVDGNGTKDVIVGRVTWLNDGRGRFTAGASVLEDTDGARVRDARLADLNGDGAIDLLAPVMPGPGGAAGIRLFLNDGKGRFRAAGQTPTPGITSAVGIGDLNGDGTPDVVVSGWRNEAKDDCPNRVLLNDGKGHLTDTGQQLDEELRHSHGLALGDFDGDRDLDVIIVAQGAPSAGHVYLNDGKGRFTSGPRIGTTSIENVAPADFDGDGDLDVFLACIGPDEVWLNDGRAVFTDSALRLGTAWSWQLAVGDVNGDRLPDVFVVNFTNDRTLPPDRSLVAHPADVWLNASRRAPAPGVASGSAGGPTPTSVTRAGRYAEDLQQARAAVAGKDHATALAAYERLIRQAPYHPGLHYQVARLSAMTGQTARAVSELETALALGYDFGEKLDDAFAAIGPEAAAPKIAGLIQQSRRQVGASRVAFTIAQRDLTPEGIAYDPKDGAFYLGSTWKSKIVRLDASGQLREFAAERQDGLRAVLGLRIDAARRTLWAASVPNPLNSQRDPNEEGTAAVFRYNLDTGRLTGTFELREPGVRHILNDLDISPRGDVFVTDSLSGAIYTIRSGGTSLELVLGSGDLLQPNGIAVSADGAALFVACTDGIYRVDIATRTARRLGQPDDICVGGFDGLYRAEGGLIGVQNGLGFRRVVRVFLNRASDAVERMVVLENRHPSLELPTTGAMAGRSFFYMANTQIYRTGEDGRLLPPEKLDDVIILRLDVDAGVAGTK